MTYLRVANNQLEPVSRQQIVEGVEVFDGHLHSRWHVVKPASSTRYWDQRRYVQRPCVVSCRRRSRRDDYSRRYIFSRHVASPRRRDDAQKEDKRLLLPQSRHRARISAPSCGRCDYYKRRLNDEHVSETPTATIGSNHLWAGILLMNAIQWMRYNYNNKLQIKWNTCADQTKRRRSPFPKVPDVRKHCIYNIIIICCIYTID